MNGGEVVFHFKGDDKDLDKKTSELGSKLGNIGKSVGGAFLKGTAVATTAITGLIATSVKGFSEMEQLSGGAKKIFDEIDYSTIEKDATNAYKSMNMSAQEYLTAINNVGATFASTMGDQKGYDTAKKGLQAISDYATGTGADINLLSEKYKMITRSTSSYLSIADQFAGLLPQTTDGFLKQAQASGFLSSEYKKLTDVPVDEYQQAITNMLEQGVDKMGLLGNTSAEAEKTISGSFLATKSALSNFISGVGSIDDVISSMTNLGNNIATAVIKMAPQVIDGLIQMTNALIPQIPPLIEKLLPTVINGATSLLNGLIKALPQIFQMIVSVLPQLIQTLLGMLPTILQVLIQMAIMSIQAVAQMLPTLIPQIVDAILQMIPILIDNLPLFIKAGYQLLIGLVEGLFNAMPTLLGYIPKIGSSIINYFKQLPGMFRDIGGMLIRGLWNGISNFAGWVIRKIRGMGSSILRAVKGIFGVHSPSREFAWIGKMNMVGLENGMEDMQPKVQQAIDGMFDLSPSLYGSTSTNLSPVVNVTNINNTRQDPLGRMVNDIKTFAGGSKNDFNYGMA
jgi:phage-related protein